MAKKKNKKNAKRSRKGGKKKGGSRRRKGGSGSRRFQMPNRTALEVAGTIVAAEIVFEHVMPDVLPDMISEDALAIWLWGYYRKQPLAQQVAYGLEAAFLAREQGLVDTIAEKVTSITDGIMPGGGALNAAPPTDEDTMGLADGLDLAESIV